MRQTSKGNPPVETDPKKIAERLELTERNRLKYRPANAAEASQQLLDHARQAQQSRARQSSRGNS